MDNSSGQAANAFKRGQYGLANLLVHPTEDFMFGAEGQWGERLNYSDGWEYDDYRVQFSMKYTFAMDILKK
jgi:hypothetical protein